MTANDFPELRAAVRDSAIGQASLWLLGAVSHAARTSTVTAIVGARADAARTLTTPEVVRGTAVVLATAAIASWALSRAIPPYLGTGIPDWGFFFGASAFGAAAAWPETVGHQWSRSRLRRVTRWLRES